MINYPISFKGPKGQLQAHFSEALVYQALQLVLDAGWLTWRHDDVSQLVRARLLDDGRSVQCQMQWPLEDKLVSVNTNQLAKKWFKTHSFKPNESDLQKELSNKRLKDN